MKRSQRWAWAVGLLVIFASLLLVSFLFTFSGASIKSYETTFARLFWTSALVAVLLLLVLAWVVVRLVQRLRAGRFGSRLLLKLAAIFGLVGILPGLVIYTVSWQFATRSLESWFDQRVAEALDAGVALGRGTLDLLKQDLGRKTAAAAERLAETPGPISVVRLERLREQLAAAELSLVSEGGQVLMSVGGSAKRLVADRPSAAWLREAKLAGYASTIEGLDHGADSEPFVAQVRSLAPVPNAQISLAAREGRLLMASQDLPENLVTQALAVQAAYGDYQERALAREALGRMVLGTLTLAMVMSVFGAVLLAIVLGNQITRPLILLAEGVKEVAAGNLEARPVFASGDELGGLTRSFADMTAQVAQARSDVQHSLVALEDARAELQTILDNLTAGVMVLDDAGRIRSANPGATRILRRPLQALLGRPLADVESLEALAMAVEDHFGKLHTRFELEDREQWQDAFELQLGAAGTEPAQVTLLARGAVLPGRDRLLVFDDISDVVSAQRAQAWAEVARRVAHEIKNPLTPIQLSAERIQHRLEAKLDDNDRAMLERSVSTIVKQVDAMKRLVNEFRDFARMPTAQLQPLSLNDLVGEVLGLYGQAMEAGVLKVELTAPLPAIMGDASQLRQVVHNLLQNALDAVEDRPHPQVRLRTEWLRTDQDGLPEVVRLSIEDSGPGFKDEVIARAFEPYVTTKVKGTGLGLAVVKKIADEHGAKVRLKNLGQAEPPGGARVSLSFFTLATSAGADRSWAALPAAGLN